MSLPPAVATLAPLQEMGKGVNPWRFPRPSRSRHFSRRPRSV